MTSRHHAARRHAGRERLLREAARLFYRLGYASTSVREIVEAAGVTKPVLYHYFGSKEGIYREIMEHTLNQFRERLAAFRSRSGTAVERIRQLSNDLFSLFLANKDHVRLMYSIYYGPPQGAPPVDFEQFHAEVVAALRSAMQEGIHSGELRPGNPEHYTWAVIGGVTVAVESHLTRKGPFLSRRSLNRILDVIISGFLAKTRRKQVRYAT